jgi:hypothetical protein
MIDGLVKITDRLIELVKYREEKSRRIFDKLIEPVFADLLLIHKNYLEIFETVRTLLPNEGDSKKKHNKKLKQAYDYLSQKRVEYEPTRIKLRVIAAKLPSLDKKQNKKDIFIRSVARYLAWTKRDIGTGSQSTVLSMEIRAAVLSISYSAVERQAEAKKKEQSNILAQYRTAFNPTAEDLNKYVLVVLEDMRRKFALVAEAYADIFAKVRDED